ncbi:MAG: NAD(P)H-hydrate dehydratase, partial [Microgenomates group bacterium]
EVEQMSAAAKKYAIVIAHKAPTSIVTDGDRVVLIEGGNPGLVKGGVGDVVAGLTVGLLAKNEPLAAAAGAIYLTKRAADRLDGRVGFMYNADDLADEVGRVYKEETK